MNLAYISATSEPGGAEISLVTLLRDLDRDRFAPYVALPGPGPLADRLHTLDIPTAFLPMEIRRKRHPLGFRRSQAAIRRWLAETRPALVHINSFWAPELAVAPAVQSGVPVVYHCRDLYDTLDRARAEAFRACDTLIVITQCVEERVKALAPDVRTHLVYNDVDLESLQAAEPDSELRTQLGWERSPVIGIASRISPDKGQLDFIRAAALIAGSYPDARFLVAGSPLFTHDKAYQTLLQDEINRLGLQSKVHFTGFRDSVAPLYKTMDICVLASLSEPFGLVVTEAMACRTPVVATRSGGPQEIITDGRDGLLVNTGHPEEIARACLTLLESIDLRKTLAEAGALTVKERFWKQEARHISLLYDDLIARAAHQKAAV